jgi:hypothetical protein
MLYLLVIARSVFYLLVIARRPKADTATSSVVIARHEMPWQSEIASGFALAMATFF